MHFGCRVPAALKHEQPILRSVDQRIKTPASISQLSRGRSRKITPGDTFHMIWQSATGPADAGSPFGVDNAGLSVRRCEGTVFQWMQIPPGKLSLQPVAIGAGGSGCLWRLSPPLGLSVQGAALVASGSCRGLRQLGNHASVGVCVS
jgi:hypothetical protein